MIEVRRIADGDLLEFKMLVRDGQRETYHGITMARDTSARMTTGKAAPEQVVEAPSGSFSAASGRSRSQAAVRLALRDLSAERSLSVPEIVRGLFME